MDVFFLHVGWDCMDVVLGGTVEVGVWILGDGVILHGWSFDHEGQSAGAQGIE